MWAHLGSAKFLLQESAFSPLPTVELLSDPSPVLQPKPLTCNDRTHRGRCQCDKQPEELVHSLRGGTALAISNEGKHSLQAAGKVMQWGQTGWSRGAVHGIRLCNTQKSLSHSPLSCPQHGSHCTSPAAKPYKCLQGAVSVLLFTILSFEPCLQKLILGYKKQVPYCLTGL